MTKRKSEQLAWESADGSSRLYCGDSLDILPTLPAESLDDVVDVRPEAPGFAVMVHECDTWHLLVALPAQAELAAAAALVGDQRS